MSYDFRTRLITAATGLIKEKGELQEYNGAKSISLMVSFARRRQEAGGSKQIVEEDVVPIKFWASGADIINDLSVVGDHIYIEAEIRQRGNRLELKAKHFELLNKGAE